MACLRAWMRSQSGGWGGLLGGEWREVFSDGVLWVGGLVVGGGVEGVFLCYVGGWVGRTGVWDKERERHKRRQVCMSGAFGGLASRQPVHI